MVHEFIKKLWKHESNVIILSVLVAARRLEAIYICSRHLYLQ